jgi:hypothetical protein
MIENKMKFFIYLGDEALSSLIDFYTAGVSSKKKYILDRIYFLIEQELITAEVISPIN